MDGDITDVAVRDWLAFCRRHYASGTVEYYTRYIKEFLTMCGKPSEGITLADLEAHQDWALEKVSRSTVNNRLKVLKAFLTWRSKRDGGENIGRRVAKLKTGPPKRRTLTEWEYNKVLAICKPIEADTLRFFAHTGIRKGDFRAMRWSSVDPDLSFMRLVGKGSKERWVPLDDVCRDILMRNHDQDQDTLLFVRRYGGCAVTLNRLCDRLAVRANVPHFYPHSVRHTFCTIMAERGVPIAKISLILGHSSIDTTTRIYTHLRKEDLRGSTDTLGLR